MSVCVRHEGGVCVCIFHEGVCVCVMRVCVCVSLLLYVCVCSVCFTLFFETSVENFRRVVVIPICQYRI